MYTKEEENLLRDSYTGSNVDELAKALNKSRRSIIGKLSRMGVYQKKVYLTKKNEIPITKLELVALFAEKAGLEIEKLEGLDKAPKAVLKYLLEKC
jgi:hypothetical protein